MVRQSIAQQLERAQALGEVSAQLDITAAAAFVGSSMAGMRVAARNGASVAALEQIGGMTMGALRTK